MDLSLQLEVGAHAVTAVLGVWLGLTVLVRSGVPGSRVFAVLALALAGWSSAVIVGRLSSSPPVVESARAVEELAAAVALAATAHFSLAIATDGHPTRRRRVAIAVVYTVLLAFAVPTVVDPSRPVSVAPPHFELGPLSGALLGWASAASRLVTLGLAIIWLTGAARAPDAAGLRRRQLAAALGTVLMGGFGAALRILPGIGDADAWIGVSFVSIAVILATYVVVSGGIFFGAAVAGRAFRTSLVGGLSLVVVVAVLVLLDGASREYLGLETPLVTGLGLVVIVALYEPLAAGLRRLGSSDGSASQARARLLRALGQPTLTARSASAGVGPALAKVATALELTSLAVTNPDGATIAAVGPPEHTGASLPLRAGDAVIGTLRVGTPRSGASLSARDEELLELSASYVAAALLTARHEDEQALELARLAEDRASVEAQATILHAALAGHPREIEPLRVLALGPLRVERDGVQIERWGGEKAGTRQAEALFAFLFDRSERGVAKDEAIELLWPDGDLERADLAFHRTLGGLRATLEPGRSAGTGAAAIRYVNDRYRLSPAIVGWSDVDAFLTALEEARAETDPQSQLRHLEGARALYRGDYLDDCPFYGDSVHVEGRRALLRARVVDLLVELGERYEASGDRLSAAGAYREAVERSEDGSPAAQAGLARLRMRTT